MKVDNGDKVKVEYTLKLDNGDIVDSSKGRDPLEFEVGAKQVIKGFENSIIGMKKDETKDVKIKPAEGYGEKIPQLMQEVPIEPFRKSQNKEPTVNMVLTLVNNKGQKVVARVIKVDKQNDKMTLDLNHILAGQNLNFNIKVVGIEKKK